jgi:sugar lactone lactonase YvrE
MALPSAVALDPQGRGFYVIDEVNGASLLRFVNTTANPVTLAGTTIQPSSINLIAGGGPSVESNALREVDLSLVTGLTVDPTGNVVFMAAPLVGAIRAVNVGAQNYTIFNQTIAPGTIKTVYQIGRPDFRALVMNSAREFFFIGATTFGGARVVYKLDPTGNGGNGLETIYAGGGTPQVANGDNGPATQAKIVQPMGLAIDGGGNLFIAEGGDNRTNPGAVRRVDPSGTITSLISQLEFPTGITVSPSGSVYVALGNLQQIIRVSSSGAKTILAGNNQGAACDLNTNPTCGDGGPALSASLNLPGSTQLITITFAADSNGFYLPDLTYKRVRYVNLTGATVNIAGTNIGPAQINSVVGSGVEPPYDNIPATISELAAPTGVAADANGNLFVADTGADPVSRIRFINRSATAVTLFAGTPWAITAQPGHIATLNNRAGDPANDDRIATAVFASPQGLAVAANGLYIVDSQYGALVRPPGSLNGRRSGHIRFLNTSSSDVTIFPQGGGARVVVPPGHIKDIVGRNDQPPSGSIGENGPANAAVIYPTDVAIDAAGNIYIADQGNNLIRRVNASTGIVTSIQTPHPEGGLQSLQTNGATGIAFGPDGRLYIADTRADRVLRQDAPGGTTFTVIANNTKGINRPRDLTVDSAGNVFVTNAGTDQVLRVVAPTNALGTAVVVAGNGQPGFSGDGGPGNRARLNLPSPGTAFNDIQLTTNIVRLASGDLVFTDTDNNRLRLLVQVPNQNPVLGDVANRTIDEGATAAVNFTATDGNQDPLTFSIANKPGFATFTDNGDGTATLQLAPGFTDAGVYNITVSASDGDATDSREFTITVNDVNRPPTVNVTPLDPTYEAASPAGRLVAPLATASDPDGDTINFRWFDGAAQIATGANPQVMLGIGNHSIFVTVTDSRGASASSTAQGVRVQDTTPPAISNVPADITAQATSDNGANVNYATPTAMDVVDGNVQVIADRAPGSLFPVGTTTVKFTAADSRGNTAMASFNVTVTPRTGGGGGGGGGNTPSSYTISTFAGSGNYGFSGDGGPATDATFKQASAIGRDSSGVTIVDGQARVVRRVDGQGRIRTIAGNGGNGNTGDGNLAIYATFGSPGGVAVDGQGNTYVSDTTNHRIRRIATDGKIYHFAGSAIAQSGSQGDNGQATAAKLNRPTALAINGDKLYIADSGNHRVRVINLSSGIITTIAGNGGAGYGGDGVPAGTASLNSPAGIAVDAAGNLYIADRNNHRIRRVDAATGFITTIAGDGTAGFAGDNGKAAAAHLNNPSDVAVDAAGNVYIVDQYNHRIRRITGGVISTIAGNGDAGYAGDGGPALQSQLSFPLSIEVDADGSVYIGDNGNLRVRKLSPAGGGGTTNRNPVITSSIGNQTLTKGQTVDLPLSATDEDGDNITFTLVNAPSFASVTNANPAGRTATLHLAPAQAGTFNNIQVQANDGRGGTATGAPFNITVNEPQPGNQPPVANAAALPGSVEATSSAGASINLQGSGSDPDGDQIGFSWTDNGTQIAASANATVALAIGAHSIALTVTDSRGARTTTPAQTVVVRDTTPPVISNVPAPITTAATSAAGANVSFAMPAATDAVDGSVQVSADRPSGSLFPVGVTMVKFTAVDSRGNSAMATLTVTVTPFAGGNTAAAYNISTFAGSGNNGFSGDGGTATEATFKQLNGLTGDANGLLIVDGYARVVRRVDAQGRIRTLAGNGANGNTGDTGLAIYATFNSPGGAAADANGNIYVSDTFNHRIRKITPDGRIYHFAGSAAAQAGSQGDNGSATAAKLNRPTALAVDAHGNVYIADSGNHRVRMVNAGTGIITTVAGNGGAGYGGDNVLASIASLNNPSGLAIDTSGNLYIADRNNHRIRRVDATTRQITTVAGDGNAGFAGDNGQATAAQLNNPSDIAVDGAGNIYIVDHYNHRIRRVVGGVIATIAGDGNAGFSGDGGAALQAQLSFPLSIEVDADGSIYFGDNGNLRVRKLTPSAPPPPPPPANHNPVITSTINNQTLTKGQSVELPLSATDEDGDGVTFTLVNAPAFAGVINSNPAGRTATLRLAPAQAGTFNNVQVRAEDGKGGSATSAPFNITVNEPPANPCQASVPVERWRGEYFNNRTFSGTPVMIRDDGQGSINFGWGLESPSTGCGVNADNFSVRWTRELPFQGGLYRFSAFSDDGVRVYIDGELKLDKWFDQGETRYDFDVAISPGRHLLRMEYYENAGGAAARLFWNALNYYPIVADIPNQTVRRGQVIEVEITATDPDGDPVSFTLINAPSFVTLINANAAQREAELRIAPPAGGADEQFNLAIRADDGRGGASTSNTFTVNITTTPPPPQNRPPVAVANTLPATVTATDSSGATIHLDGSGSSDPDGDPLTYSWTDQGTVIATSAVADVKLPLGSHLIALTVNDGKGGVNSTVAQSVTINAPAPPPPPPATPAIDSISPSSGKRGTTVNMVITGTGFAQGASVAINGGSITTSTTFVSSNQLNVRVTIAANAFTTVRSVTVTIPGSGSVTKVNSFAVTP